MTVLCPSEVSEGSAVLHSLTLEAARSHVPLSGAIELTERCNLGCVHCYLGSLRSPQGGAAELGTPRLLEVLDEAVEAGCLFLLMTGGEPLLRPDFAAVYRHAREHGVMVTVFTNGTLVSDDHCALFSELSPSVVEITLYGGSAPTYEAVTRVPGSFARCIAGVERLVSAGVRVGLKTMLLTANYHELDDMRALAAELGVPFRFDAGICGRLDGDRSPLDLRLPAAQAVAIELADDERRAQWLKHYERLKAVPAPSGLYGCGAGVSSFFIDSRGVMYPCLMARSVSYDVANKPFLPGWRDVIPQIRELAAGGMQVCNECQSRAFCDACPGLLGLETGAEDGHSEYICALGRARDAAIGQRHRAEAASHA